MNLQLRDIPILKDNELLKNNNSIELPCEISKDDLIFITPENINKVIEVLEYFSIKSYKIQSYIISNSVTTFEKFILNEKYINEYELPKFLKESIKDIDDLEDFLVCIDYCAEFGMFKWLKFLLENGNTFDEDFEDLSYSWACYNAAEKGSLECLKLLREYKFPWDDKVTNIAGVNKNIDCFIYAYENYCPFNEYIMSDLIQYGSLDCLKFLHQKEDFLSDSLCITAAHYGQYECLKYCYENKNLTLKNVSNKYLKNKYFKKYGYTEEQLNAINGWNNITSHMIPNNSKRNKDFEFETNESKWSNNNKKEIYLRMYLKKIGFTNLKQFKNMYKWFIYFWLDNEDLFINKISFEKEDFMNRIIIVEQNEDVLGNLNILYQKSQEKDKISKIINNPKYINLKVLLDYINKSDENREKFNRWVTGSAYSTSVIKIYINPDVRDLWDVSTCSAAIQVKSSKNNIKNINYNTLYSILLSLINSDLEKPKLTTE